MLMVSESSILSPSNTRFVEGTVMSKHESNHLHEWHGQYEYYEEENEGFLRTMAMEKYQFQ